MECSIYGSDRAIPATAKKYLAEVKSDSEIWKNMPRRILRHRALQQYARLAMGIHIATPDESSDPSARSANLKDRQDELKDSDLSRKTGIDLLKIKLSLENIKLEKLNKC